MSGELRAVLAEALVAHGALSLDASPEGDVIECACGWHYTREDHAKHQASVITSLPGVAVIQLPKPTEAVTMQDCAGSGKPFKPATLSRDGEVAKCSACGTNRYVRDDGSIEPHQVPVAAVVAEGEGAK
ncbi:hypothetical protein SEA_MARSHA_82 [Mycobacterium phage Marsha]|nr:hypothetical protein SEA_MARSHA_82 [Mycobacterium phage Marsha]